MICLNPSDIRKVKTGIQDRNPDLVESVIGEVRGYMISEADSHDTIDLLDMIAALIDDLNYEERN